MKYLFRTTLFLILGISSSHLYAFGNLPADQVRQLFTGNTVEGERREYGAPGTGFAHKLNNFAEKTVSKFEQDGTLDEQVGDHHKTGKWHVDDNGDLCVELEGREEHCAPVMKQGGSYIRDIRNKKGRELAQIRYITFVPGTKK
jgi:hypothetical protein